MTDRRQLSEQSRRYNAMIADAVMRAEAEGRRVVPASEEGRGGGCCCPMGALAEDAAYPPASHVSTKTQMPRRWAQGFINGFDGALDVPPWSQEAYHLGRLYRARALRMHGGGQ